MIANHFPTDPDKGAAEVRSPWTLRFEAVPFDRFALEATGGDGGAGFGMRTALYVQDEVGVDATLGVDELFFSPQDHLFGVESDQPTSRVWLGAARSWKRARVSASVAVQPSDRDVEFVPYATAEVRLPFHSSLGIETSYLRDVWRVHAGASLDWDPLVIGFGMTEVQSWFGRDGEFGFFNEARPGGTTGFDTPGWWFSVSVDLPRPKAPPPPPVPKAVSSRLDSADIRRLESAMVERSVRADLAELALRFQAEGIDPLESGALRRRILSGGAVAKAVLLRIALDSATTPEERTLAVSIAVTRPTEEDLPALGSLTEEPSPSLRVETALALRRLPGSPRAEELLLRLRNDPDATVRAAATGDGPDR